MRAAVLHGREDVRMEEVPVPRPGPGEVRAAHAGGAHLRDRRQGVPPRLPRPHDHAARALRPRGGGRRRGGRRRRRRRVDAGHAGRDRELGAVRRAARPAAAAGASLCDDLLFWNGAYAELALIPARIVAKNLVPLPAGPVVPAGGHGGAARLRRARRRGSGDRGRPDRGGHRQRADRPDVRRAWPRPRGRACWWPGAAAARLEKALELGAAAVVSGRRRRRRRPAAARDGRGGQGPDVVVEAAGRAETSEAALRPCARAGPCSSSRAARRARRCRSTSRARALRGDDGRRQLPPHPAELPRGAPPDRRRASSTPTR